MAALAALALAAGSAPAQDRAAAPAARTRALVDRVVVRWFAPETGGPARPQFVFERELRFVARLEALADPDTDSAVFRERHVRAALDRIVAETLLASLVIVPASTSKELVARTQAARALLDQRVHGQSRLAATAAAEGIAPEEIDALLRRSAKASLYLDRMVAPTVACSEAELRALHQAGGTPLDGQPYEAAAPGLQRWCDGGRLAQAVDGYYQNARSRVTLVLVKGRPAPVSNNAKQ